MGGLLDSGEEDWRNVVIELMGPLLGPMIRGSRSILVCPRMDVFSSLAFLSLGRTSRNVTAGKVIQSIHNTLSYNKTISTIWSPTVTDSVQDSPIRGFLATLLRAA